MYNGHRERKSLETACKTRTIIMNERGLVVDTLRIRVVKTLQKGKPLSAEELSMALSEKLKAITGALYALKKNGTVDILGKKPWRYFIKKSVVDEVGGSIGKSIIKLISSSPEPLNAREVSERLDMDLASVRYFLSRFKHNGLIVAVGKQPWHYTVEKNTEPEKPETPESASTVTKKFVDTLPKVPTELIVEPPAPEPAPEFKMPNLPEEFLDFLIVYTLKGFPNEPLTRSYDNVIDFKTSFQSLQDDSDLEEISAYRKMNVKKKTLLVPEI